MEAGVGREFRKCLNVKSRANPHIQCPLSATQGDYCSRHYKKPNPFKSKTKSERIYTRTETTAVKKIQGFWRRKALLGATGFKDPL